VLGRKGGNTAGLHATVRAAHAGGEYQVPGRPILVDLLVVKDVTDWRCSKPRSEPGNTAASLPSAGILLPSQSLENTLPWCRETLCAVRMRSSRVGLRVVRRCRAQRLSALLCGLGRNRGLVPAKQSHLKVGRSSPQTASSALSPQRRRFRRFRLLTQSGSSNSKLSFLDEC
jgi:hypothetical protein